MLHKKYMKYIDAFNNAYKSVNKTYVPTDARKPSKINGFKAIKNSERGIRTLDTTGMNRML